MQLQFWRRQQGSTLIICLVFLLILTMIGISSIQSSTLQEQMAGSARDYNSAFQAAEYALREGEVYLQQATLGSFTGSGGRYTICGDPASTAAGCVPPSWRNKSSTGWVTQSGVGNVNSQPQYILEKYPLIVDVNAPLDADTVPPKIEMYRITARGYGVSENSMIVLQSAFRRD
ncbi:hypothetical protein TMS3_0106845 [Pseudomonas taeanensis MS-3]|jgi:type IV pilus assembly protein PilX|uniref:Pilus assembly protein PilX n=1 Tax=Pseudomonas taeanensis MS-3 TaxID=1395571 RepID=A0A0A1YQP6_9PSED|nr:PilX N-terminal domain-containing pilus assembly protein [Pseudomonas taeanensis]KFX71636.1 hypothetical protein TMS3_0106845 [Pseudomonas taeanensis MS-3]